MMEEKGKNAQPESSLLLQLPNSMLSFSEMSSSPVLMPVAVEQTDDSQRGRPSLSSGPTSSNSESLFKQPAPASKSICQLEQPLLMRKTSTNPPAQTSAPQVYSQFAVSPHSGPLPINTQTGFSAPPAGSEPAMFAVKSNSEYESSECHEPEWSAVIPPHYNGIQGHESFSSPSSSAAFCPVTSENQASNFYPTSSSEMPGYSTAYNFTSPGSHSQDQSHFQMDPNHLHSNTQNPNDLYFHYAPPKPHWLFEETVESREIWYGFSEVDSERLEAAFQTGSTIDTIVPTDGGRYDVCLESRMKKSVYSDAKDLPVRRGTWFYGDGSSSRFKPYTEDTAKMLEQHFYNCVTSRHWQRRFNIPGIGSFVFESSQVMLHYKNELEVWPTLPDSKASPKVVKRGLPDGFEILPNESSNIDHLVFIVQGIGSFCDLRFRTVSQCVDGFRDIANKLIASHFRNEVEQGFVTRVEFLPVAWHAKLHTSDVGLDRQMQNITLPSIPKLRHFTNDTLIDILLYSTPSYCQSIIDTVACELNMKYDIFLTRNPHFSGKVFVAGHSLGSLILFDILTRQKISENEISSKQEDSLEKNMEAPEVVKNQNGRAEMMPSDCETHSNLETPGSNDFEKFQGENIDSITMNMNNLELETSTLSTDKEDPNKACAPSDSSGSVSMIYPAPAIKSGMSLIVYPMLKFQPACFFALGSPISMFLAVRGYDTISEDFKFPTCPAFFHIFHPYDPVAFRIEPLIDPNFSAKPVLIPHHKGRKRMHLEIRENVTKIASEIKQKLMDTMRYTWNSLSEFAKNHSFPSAILEAEVDKLVEQEMSEPVDAQEQSLENIQIGLLNGGRRIDYVLQEKPIEALNDYVFALTSHATYWDSEDTVLMILREIYAMQGIVISNQQIEARQPVQNKDPLAESGSLDSISFINTPESCTNTERGLDFHHTLSSTVPIVPSNNTENMHIDSSNVIPTMACSQAPSAVPGSQHIGPPPLSGFVKRSPFQK